MLERLISTQKREKVKVLNSQEADLNDYKQITKKYKIEKKLRKQIIELEDDEFKIKAMKEEAEKQIKTEEDYKAALERKKMLLEQLSEKAKSRHEQIFKQKQIILEPNPIKNKPKYVEMEETYKITQEMPELERRKAELAKKRIIYQPISRKDWLNHLKKYNEIISEAEKKRLAKLEESSQERSISIVNTQRRAQVLELHESKAMKKSMIDKRKQYAELVRDVYGPKIDLVSTKSKEILKPEPEKLVSKETKENTISIVKKKLKPKLKTIPESKTPELKSENKLDYLAERRIKRTQQAESLGLDDALNCFSNISFSDDKSKVLEKLQKYEKLTAMQELKMKQINPDSKLGLSLEEKINEVLTKSIRAKLELLDHKSL